MEAHEILNEQQAHWKVGCNLEVFGWQHVRIMSFLLWSLLLILVVFVWFLLCLKKVSMGLLLFKQVWDLKSSGIWAPNRTSSRTQRSNSRTLGRSCRPHWSTERADVISCLWSEGAVCRAGERPAVRVSPGFSTHYETGQMSVKKTDHNETCTDQ